MIKDLILDLDLDPVEFIELEEKPGASDIGIPGAIYRTTDGYLYFGNSENKIVPVNSSKLENELEKEDKELDFFSASDELIIEEDNNNKTAICKGFKTTFSDYIAYIPKYSAKGYELIHPTEHFSYTYTCNNVYEIHIPEAIWEDFDYTGVNMHLPNLTYIVIDTDKDSVIAAARDKFQSLPNVSGHPHKIIRVDKESDYGTAAACMRNVDNFLVYYEHNIPKSVEAFLLEKTAKVIKFPTFENYDADVTISADIFQLDNNVATDLIVPEVSENAKYLFENGCFNKLTSLKNVTIDEVFLEEASDPSFTYSNPIKLRNILNKDTEFETIKLTSSKYYFSPPYHEPLYLCTDGISVNSLEFNVRNEYTRLQLGIYENILLETTVFKTNNPLTITADNDFKYFPKLKKLYAKNVIFNDNSITLYDQLQELHVTESIDYSYVFSASTNPNLETISCDYITDPPQDIQTSMTSDIQTLIINNLTPTNSSLNNSLYRFPNLVNLTLNFRETPIKPIALLGAQFDVGYESLRYIKTNNVNGLAAITYSANKYLFYNRYVESVTPKYYADRRLVNSETDEYITDLVLTCKTIQQYAFAGCSTIRSVTAKNLTFLGTNAFKDCYQLGKFIVDPNEITPEQIQQAATGVTRITYGNKIFNTKFLTFDQIS